MAWGYTTPGPEPEPLFELSGLFAAAVLLLGPFLYFSLADGDLNSCVFRPTQEVCKASAPRGQLSQREQQLQDLQKQAALNNAIRRQCLRNALSEDDAAVCPGEQVVVPGGRR